MLDEVPAKHREWSAESSTLIYTTVYVYSLFHR